MRNSVNCHTIARRLLESADKKRHARDDSGSDSEAMVDKGMNGDSDTGIRDTDTGIRDTGHSPYSHIQEHTMMYNL